MTRRPAMRGADRTFGDLYRAFLVLMVDLFSAVILQIWRGGSRMMLYFFPSRNHQG
jgi:hypothetical protein